MQFPLKVQFWLLYFFLFVFGLSIIEWIENETIPTPVTRQQLSFILLKIFQESIVFTQNYFSEIDWIIKEKKLNCVNKSIRMKKRLPTNCWTSFEKNMIFKKIVEYSGWFRFDKVDKDENDKITRQLFEPIPFKIYFWRIEWFFYVSFQKI